MDLNAIFFLLCQVLLYSSVSSKKVCGRPSAPDGIDVTTLKRVYEVGEELSLTCEQGYLASSKTSGRITCTASGEWTQSELACSAKMCSIPRPLQPLAMGRTEAPLKSVLNFTCDDGYVMMGANESRCLQDGTWSNPPPLCKAVSCPLPKAPRDGRIVYDKPVTGTNTMYGQSWTYECNSPKVPSYERGSCMADGSVTEPPICQDMIKTVNCPLPKAPRDGRIVYDKPVTGANPMYGQSWTYECNSPKAPSYERGSCMTDGSVTEPPICREVSCSIPTNIPNGFITFAVLRPHGYKEKVKYACNEHYTLDGEAEIQCTNSGNWSQQPACKAYCTVGIKRGRIFYNAKKVWIADLKPNRVLHGEHVAFYCLNRAEKCGYPVVSTCNDGVLHIPECFEEPGKMEYTLKAKTLPSEITMCATSPPAGPSNSSRPA